MSLNLPVIIKATAPDKPDDINEFVLQLLLLVKKQCSISPLEEKNFKLILVELVTNAIKHVKDFENIIEIYLDKPVIKISKIDNGPKFNPPVNHQKSANNYYTEILKDGTISFNHKDLRDNEELNSFPENFGFEIIAKASKEFNYLYDVEQKANIFTAVISS